MRAILAVLALSVVAAPAQAAPALDGARKAVVTVLSDAGEGSAFYISPTEIVTAAHVVGNQKEHLTIGGGASTKDATVSKISRGLDLALIRTPVAGSTVLELRDAAPAVGDAVFAARSDIDGFSVSRGIVSAIRTLSDIDYVQTDAAVNPGNSGGPLLSETGEVVGVVQSKKMNSEGVALAITASTVQSFLAGTAVEPKSAPTQQEPTRTSGESRWPLLILLGPLVAIVYLVRRRPREIKIQIRS